MWRPGVGKVCRLAVRLQRQQCRFLATRSAADAYLVQLLSAEILQKQSQCQRQLPQQPQPKPEPTYVGPFQLIDMTGKEEVVLARTVGSEKIEILCMIEKQYPEEEEEEESEQRLQHKQYHHYNKSTSKFAEDDIVEVLHLNVKIHKGEGTLELDCSYVKGASEVMIEHVLFHAPTTTPASVEQPELTAISASIEQPEPYGGPIFEDLDEDLQRAFHELLQARGLSAKVARYMIDYMSNKEKSEYVRWLHRLKVFLTC